MTGRRRHVEHSLLFHIAAAEDWAKAGTHYAPAHLAAEGFIHCSTRTQIAAVAGRLFRGRNDLVLLAIDADRLSAPVRYESLGHGTERYPHIYGPLNRDAVVAAQPLRVREDGRLDLRSAPSE